MHLKQVELKAFRCFDQVVVTLHPRLTVLVAENAGGKTAVLDAVAKGLSAWNVHFSSADQRLEALQIADDDLQISLQQGRGGKEVTRAADYASVVLRAEDGSDGLVWGISHSRTPESAPAGLVGTDQIKSRAMKIREAIYHGDESIEVPVFAYYNVHRGHANQEVKSRTHPPKIDYSQRLAALLDSLTPELREFSEIVSWFKDAALDELSWEKRNLGATDDQGNSLSYSGPLPHLREAFANVLGDRVSDPRWEAVTGQITVDFKTADGRKLSLNFEQLSQGFSSILALVFDLTQRLVVANPYYWSHYDYQHGNVVEGGGRPLEAPAIVLIDEVDLHLHPSWQQRVLGDLVRAFPGTQFIVTTHSPQVLTTVNRENIRILAQDADGIWSADMPDEETKGIESSTAMNDVMGVNQIPPVPEAGWRNAYTALIENGVHATREGIELRAQLAAHYGKQHPIILDFDRLIRFQAFKRRTSQPSE